MDKVTRSRKEGGTKNESSPTADRSAAFVFIADFVWLGIVMKGFDQRELHDLIRQGPQGFAPVCIPPFSFTFSFRRESCCSFAHTQLAPSRSSQLLAGDIVRVYWVRNRRSHELLDSGEMAIVRHGCRPPPGNLPLCWIKPLHHTGAPCFSEWFVRSVTIPLSPRFEELSPSCQDSA